MYRIGSEHFFTDMNKNTLMGRVIEVHIYKEQGNESYYLLIDNGYNRQRIFFELLMNEEQQEELNQVGRSYFGNVNYVRDIDLRPEIVGTVSKHKPHYIYKICKKSEWEAAKNQYTGNERDQKDGYIHLSLSHQVERIAKKYYLGQNDLVLLKIPVSKIRSILKWSANSTGDLYPHLYGAITEADVDQVIPLTIQDFDFNSLEA